jgi:hypothetical protein
MENGITSTCNAIASLQLSQLNCSQLIRVRKMWVKLGEHPPDIL